VRGDAELSRLVDGLDDSWNQVSEGFADSRSRFEEKRFVGFHRSGDSPGHLILLRTVIELEAFLEPAALGKNFRGEFWRVTPGWRRRRGFVAKANHGA